MYKNTKNYEAKNKDFFTLRNAKPVTMFCKSCLI